MGNERDCKKTVEENQNRSQVCLVDKRENIAAQQALAAQIPQIITKAKCAFDTIASRKKKKSNSLVEKERFYSSIDR